MSGADNPVLCGHNLPATRFTVKKDGPNKGRLFYKCAQATDCGIFIWDDERPRQTNPAPVTPTSSQQTIPSQPMSQGSFRSQGMSTPGKKRAVPHEDDDDGVRSPFDTPSKVPFTPNKRVKIEGSSSSLGQAWAPPSPATPAASQPSGSQNIMTSPNDEDDEFLEQMVENLHELSAYIKKLKRKKIAAEKSSQVKSKKIADLQKEVERLKARELELEEALAG